MSKKIIVTETQLKKLIDKVLEEEQKKPSKKTTKKK
jgi:hypothetical protein